MHRSLVATNRRALLATGIVLAMLLTIARGHAATAYHSEVRTLSGLRLDISTPIVDEDLVDGLEIDTAIAAEILSHHRRPFAPASPWKLGAAFGLFSTFQTAEAGDQDIFYSGNTLRAHLGLVYEFGDSARIELMPYVGIGLGWLDLDTAQLAIREPGLITEVGATLGAFVNLGRIDIGAGAAYTSWRSRNKFRHADDSLIEIEVEQDYPSAFVSVGYRF
ncbi:MAG: hypothetical protein ACOCZK_06005 [Planctomycetota bacterium]